MSRFREDRRFHTETRNATDNGGTEYVRVLQLTDRQLPLRPSASHRRVPPSADKRRVQVPDEVFTLALRLRDRFEAEILPCVSRLTRAHFRWLRPQEREELDQEAAAVAWRSFLSALQHGNDPLSHLGLFLKWVMRYLKRFCFLCGRESADDVLSRRAQRLRRFRVWNVNFH